MSAFTTLYSTGLSAWQVEDGMKMAVNLGVNTLRLWCGGFGNAVSLYPTLGGSFNSASFAYLDQALALAATYKLRVILTLADGVATTAFGDVASGFWGDTDFYNNATCKANYETYCDGILNHVSGVTGVAIKNNPSILCVELINEPNSVPAAWTTAISAHVKATAPSMNFMDGKNGTIASASLINANLAAVTRHNYPMDTSDLTTLLATANLSNKVFLVGEVGWNGTKGGDVLVDTYTAFIEANPAVAGDLLWMLTPHDDINGGWITSFGGDPSGSQGYAIRFGDQTARPTSQASGAYATMHAMQEAWRLHFYRRRGITVAPPFMTPDAPLILAVNASTHTVTYRGAAGAKTYNVQTSADNVTYANLVTGQTDIAGGTVTNAALTAGVWVRIVGVNPDGVSGTPSAGVQMV